MVAGGYRFQACVRVSGGHFRLEKAVHDHFALRGEGTRFQRNDLLPVAELRSGLHGDDGRVVVLIQRNDEKAPLRGKKSLCRNGQRVFDGSQPAVAMMNMPGRSR